MMHREVVAKKRVPVITMGLFLVTIMLYLDKGVERLGYGKNVIGHTVDLALVLVSMFFIIKQIIGCSVSYKYAVIADKLIINLIKNKGEENLESIKISDVLYIGEKSRMPKEYQNLRKSKKYLFDTIGTKSYYCVYKKDDKLVKIKFQPSDKFIMNIFKHGRLKCNLNKIQAV